MLFSFALHNPAELPVGFETPSTTYTSIFSTILALFCATRVFAGTLSSTSSFIDVAFSNKRKFFWDVSGDPIGNGEGKIIYIDNQYLWFGTQDCKQTGVRKVNILVVDISFCLANKAAWSWVDFKTWYTNGVRKLTIDIS